jgi:hypothetical protein
MEHGKLFLEKKNHHPKTKAVYLAAIYQKVFLSWTLSKRL